MRTNWSYLILVGLFLGSCSVPRYLSSPEEIGLNPYGAYITINYQRKEELKGELIAVENDVIVIREDVTNHWISFPKNKVITYKIWYANPKRYGWTIPVALILPLIHGWWSYITVPTHILVTSIVTGSSYNAFSYNQKDIDASSTELKMFSRFPAGLPPNFKTIEHR